MATGDTNVSTFFNDLTAVVASYDKLCEPWVRDKKEWRPDASRDPRLGIQRLIDHMGPNSRSGIRHSNWPVTTKLMLNDLNFDRSIFPVDLSTLNQVIFHNGGLMGIEYMGHEKGDAGKVNPKYRFLTLSVPSTGAPVVGGTDVVVYFPKDPPKNRNCVASFDKIDAIVKAAVQTGGSEHIRVVAEAFKRGYQDISAPARLKAILNGP